MSTAAPSCRSVLPLAWGLLALAVSACGDLRVNLDATPDRPSPIEADRVNPASVSIVTGGAVVPTDASAIAGTRMARGQLSGDPSGTTASSPSFRVQGGLHVPR